MSRERTVRIVEREGPTVHIVAESSKGRIEVMAEMYRRGDGLLLRNVHVEGAGPNTIGLGEVRAFVRVLAQQHSATKVVIEGGRRTTGAIPGRFPKSMTFNV